MSRLLLRIAFVFLVLPVGGFAQNGNVSEKAADGAINAKVILPLTQNQFAILSGSGQVGICEWKSDPFEWKWDLYSEVKWDAHPSLAPGPVNSLLFASRTELTQAFDTTGDGKLDFFQALLQDWPRATEGVRITAGPVVDRNGRVFFSFSPFTDEGESSPRARLVAWHPEAAETITVTESQLPISAFAISDGGLLAARLDIPGYREGYYVSLTELPPFDANAVDARPDPVPFTLPSLLIPADLTDGANPDQLTFFEEDGKEKLLATCSDSQRIIEIVPAKAGSRWQGSIILRAISPTPMETIAELAPGFFVTGGSDGVKPIDLNADVFRIDSLGLAQDGVELGFTQPVDRIEAVEAGSYAVTAVSFDGGRTSLPVEPVIESNGRTIILKTGSIPSNTVLRIECQKVRSEAGESLFSTSAFYVIHQK